MQSSFCCCCRDDANLFFFPSKYQRNCSAALRRGKSAFDGLFRPDLLMYISSERAHNCFTVGCPTITALWKHIGGFNLNVLIWKAIPVF